MRGAPGYGRSRPRSRSMASSASQQLLRGFSACSRRPRRSESAAGRRRRPARFRRSTRRAGRRRTRRVWRRRMRDGLRSPRLLPSAMATGAARAGRTPPARRYSIQRVSMTLPRRSLIASARADDVGAALGGLLEQPLVLQHLAEDDAAACPCGGRWSPCPRARATCRRTAGWRARRPARARAPRRCLCGVGLMSGRAGSAGIASPTSSSACCSHETCVSSRLMTY